MVIQALQETHFISALKDLCTEQPGDQAQLVRVWEMQALLDQAHLFLWQGDLSGEGKAVDVCLDCSKAFDTISLSILL